MAERKCKLKGWGGKEIDCTPSPECKDCEYNNSGLRIIPPVSFYEELRKEREELDKKMKAIDPSKYNVTETGQVLKSLSPEQYEEQKKALNCNDKKNDGIYLRTYDYNKIQNYIEAIRLIAEKVGMAESNCIEQLARDTGNYLYDLVKGDKND